MAFREDILGKAISSATSKLGDTLRDRESRRREEERRKRQEKREQDIYETRTTSARDFQVKREEAGQKFRESFLDLQNTKKLEFEAASSKQKEQFQVFLGDSGLGNEIMEGMNSQNPAFRQSSAMKMNVLKKLGEGVELDDNDRQLMTQQFNPSVQMKASMLERSNAERRGKADQTEAQIKYLESMVTRNKAYSQAQTGGAGGMTKYQKMQVWGSISDDIQRYKESDQYLIGIKPYLAEGGGTDEVNVYALSKIKDPAERQAARSILYSLQEMYVMKAEHSPYKGVASFKGTPMMQETGHEAIKLMELVEDYDPSPDKPRKLGQVKPVKNKEDGKWYIGMKDKEGDDNDDGNYKMSQVPWEGATGQGVIGRGLETGSTLLEGLKGKGVLPWEIFKPGFESIFKKKDSDLMKGK